MKRNRKGNNKKGKKNLDPIQDVQDLLGNFMDYPTWLSVVANGCLIS